MKILDKAIIENGVEIQLEDWSGKNTEEYPNLYGLVIAAYPIAKNTSKYGWVRSGERFRLSVGMNKYAGYTNEEVKKDYEALKSGEKKLKDLSEHFENGDKDRFYLGMIDKLDE